MKKIILFEGDIESQGFFSRQMAAALKELGHEVFIYDLSKPWKASSDLLRFFQRGNTVVLAFNFHGMCQEVQFIDEERNVYIWDDLEIPCYNILADHPYYYYQLLAQRPGLYTQLSIDLEHEVFMRRFFPEVELGPFLPLAGTELTPLALDGHESAGLRDELQRSSRYPAIKDRGVDIVFTGNYATPKRFEKYITRIDDEYTAFYYEMIDELLTRPSQTVEAVVERFVKDRIEDVTEADLKTVMKSITFIDLYVRYHIRGDVIRSLVDGGIKVSVFGDKWNEFECEHPENLMDGDSLYSVECLEMIRNSKISLNIMPWFKNGPHDRIFNTMLNGSLCLTDSNVWLDRILRDGENCSIYDLCALDALPDMVRQLLSDTDRMQSIADKGYALGRENTWAQRMKIFSDYIEGR